MRLAAALLTAAFLAASLAACGSSGSGAETTHAGAAQRRPSRPIVPAGARTQSCGAATRVEGLGVVATSCGEARHIARTWGHQSGCRPGAGASRAGCRVGSFRCTAVRADRGIAVSCARPGGTIAFIVPHR